MHSSNIESGVGRSNGDILVAIAAHVTEGRIPLTKACTKSKGFIEGPHCTIGKTNCQHTCDPNEPLCRKYTKTQSKVNGLCEKGVPFCVEVHLRHHCSCPTESAKNDILLEQWYFQTYPLRASEPVQFQLPQLLNAIRSQLHFSQLSAWLSSQDKTDSVKISGANVRYSLTIPGETFETAKFSQTPNRHNFPNTALGNGLALSVTLVSLPRISEPPLKPCGTCQAPPIPPLTPQEPTPLKNANKSLVFDDRMLTSCTLNGKHRCDEFEDFDSTVRKKVNLQSKRMCHLNNTKDHATEAGTSDTNRERLLRKANENLEKYVAKSEGGPKSGEYFQRECCSPKRQYYTLQEGEITAKDIANKSEKRNMCIGDEQSVKSLKLDLESNEEKDSIDGKLCKNEAPGPRGRRAEAPGAVCDTTCVRRGAPRVSDSCDNYSRDFGDIFSRRQNIVDIFVDPQCDSPPGAPKGPPKKMQDISNLPPIKPSKFKGKARQKLTFDEEEDNFENNVEKVKFGAPISTEKPREKDLNGVIPSVVEQAKFRKSFDNAASMVFHSRTGLPLTSSPAPIRRGTASFDFDSSITSVSAIKSALFSVSCSTDDDSESDGSIVSPCSPDTFTAPVKEPPPLKYRRKGHSGNLLGTFEESVLNGRLEPVSTVQGFRAELGASGSFVPKHLHCPVTVFFYNLGDSDKISSPYLGHINLGKKGYNVPKAGTVQVTLFNPLGTVVKMFVIIYDLSDMPPNAQTFMRQRTLYMPTNSKDENVEWGPKWLRYLVHLRFMSSKSGKIYLHSDIRMIIFRQSDLDTATAHGRDMSYELRSFIHMPSNPKYSLRK